MGKFLFGSHVKIPKNLRMSMILMIVLLHVLFGMFVIIVLTSSFVYICSNIYTQMYAWIYVFII